MDELDKLSKRNLDLTRLGKENAHPKLRHGLAFDRYANHLEIPSFFLNVQRFFKKRNTMWKFSFTYFWQKIRGST